MGAAHKFGIFIAIISLVTSVKTFASNELEDRIREGCAAHLEEFARKLRSQGYSPEQIKAMATVGEAIIGALTKQVLGENETPVAESPRVGFSSEISTSTVLSDGRMTPWLAADGLFSYTPENPPVEERQFHYGLAMPNSFRHPGAHVFGAYGSSIANSFWRAAQGKRTSRVYLKYGENTSHSFDAPIAVYEIAGENEYWIWQGGNYLRIEKPGQPFMRDGKIILYRGIGDRNLFRAVKWDLSDPVVQAARTSYFNLQSIIFGDSAFSFALPYWGTARSGTEHIDFVYLDILKEFKKRFTPNRAEFGASKKIGDLAKREANFTPSHYIASFKFGPRFVQIATPLSNIHFTSGWNTEEEVHLIDPARIEILDADGVQMDTKKITAEDFRGED